MRHVFIIGSRGLPAKYGGFETFVAELVKHQLSQDIQYHVACLSDKDHHRHFTYENVDCFTIKAPKLGPARVIAYDMMAIQYALSIVERDQIKKPIFYILGNTIGAFIAPFARNIKKAGGLFYINPDGLEWKRSKWSKPIQTYLKYAEKCMTKSADLVVSDNVGIENYIKNNKYLDEIAIIIAINVYSSFESIRKDLKKSEYPYLYEFINQKKYSLEFKSFCPICKKNISYKSFKKVKPSSYDLELGKISLCNCNYPSKYNHNNIPNNSITFK